jgi:hypothetical protein
MAGVDLRTVAGLMGHKTIQMTMRYAHLAPAHKSAAVSKGWQRSGRSIDQLTPKLTPALSSKNPGLYGKPANIGLDSGQFTKNQAGSPHYHPPAVGLALIANASKKKWHPYGDVRAIEYDNMI